MAVLGIFVISELALLYNVGCGVLAFELPMSFFLRLEIATLVMTGKSDCLDCLIRPKL